MDSWITERRLTAADYLAGLAGFGLLFAIYFFTASLRFETGDELFMYDTAVGFSRRGSVLRSMTADMDWPGETYVEPAQPVLAVPLIWLADQSDRIGNAHAAMLFNPLVTAATAVVLMLYVRRLGYGMHTAVFSALLFGLTTIAWPYTKTFHREPLCTLGLLVAAYGLLRWRQSWSEPGAAVLPWLALALVGGAASVLAKEAGLIGLPLLMLIPLLGRRFMPRSGGQLAATGLLALVLFVIAVGGLYYYMRVLGAGGPRFDVMGRIGQAISNRGLLLEGLVGLLLSPGKGVFWHSPVLLLALLGPWFAGSRRFDVGWPLLLLLAFALVYALVRGQIWYGGTNWGARYLVPVTPFLMLAAAPIIERALRPAAILWRLGILIVALAGLAVQVPAVAINLLDYYRVLEATGIPGAPWTVAIWTPYYSAILGNWRMLLAGTAVDFAWARALTAGADWQLAALLIAAAALCGALLRRALRKPAGYFELTGWCLAVAVGLLVLGFVSLRRLYPDQRYRGDSVLLQAMRSALESGSKNTDAAVFLNNRTYFDFMLNYFKGRAVWYTLELNPNELIAPGAQHPTPSTDPFDILNVDAWTPVDYFGRQHAKLFLLMESGPYTPNVTRALEWAMNTDMHRVRALEFSNEVRLLEFSTSKAPARAAPPEFALDNRVGDSLVLRGYDAKPPAGLVSPGSILNISTQWQAAENVPAALAIGTYLMNPQGAIAFQDDSVPVGGFWPSADWQAGAVVRHNVAFVLPIDLPPGHYDVWCIVYSQQDGTRLAVTDAAGTSIRDYVLLYGVEIAR